MMLQLNIRFDVNHMASEPTIRNEVLEVTETFDANTDLGTYIHQVGDISAKYRIVVQALGSSYTGQPPDEPDLVA